MRTGSEINYKLIRTKRKTMALHITKDAGVEIRAPLDMPYAEIDSFVASNRDWISSRLSVMERRVEGKASFKLDYGSYLRLLGCEYPITARPGTHSGFDGECFYLPPNLTSDEIKSIIIHLYKLFAKDFLTERTLYFARLMGLKPSSIKISGAKNRWGSCSNRNSINFSWRLIMAGKDAIDSVVVHELAHILEHNHSDRFWAPVLAVMPDYAKRQAQLNSLYKRLLSEDWD